MDRAGIRRAVIAGALGLPLAALPLTVEAAQGNGNGMAPHHDAGRMGDHGWSQEFGPYPDRADGRRDEAPNGTAADAAAVAGTVDSFRRIRPQGERQARTLMKLRLQDGRAVIVDLGPRSIQSLDLHTGDDIRVRGDWGSIDGRRVLKAERVAVTDKFPVDRARQRDGRQQAADQPRQIRARGTVGGFREARIDGEEEHTLMLIELDDGDTVLVDLGPQADLQDVDLQQADRVVVTGRPDRLQGQPLLVAERIAREEEQDRQARIFRRDLQDDQAWRAEQLVPGRHTMYGTHKYRTTIKAHTEEALQEAGKTRAGQVEPAGGVSIDGTIDSFRKAPVDGGREHTLMKVTLEDGQSFIVDLGPQADPAELGLEQDDQVTIKGRWDEVEGRRVLRAQMIKVAPGQQQQAQQQPAQQQETRQGRAAAGDRPGEQRIAGTVAKVEQADIQGQGDRDVLRIELEEGEQVLVALEPGLAAKDLDLQEQDRIVIRGRSERIQDQDVIVADQIVVEGEQVGKR